MFVIETEDLEKQYGSVQALKGVSLRLEAGRIFGLLGRNGAGKTTFVKVLLGLVRASGGTAKLLDRPAGDPAGRERVGYLPEDHRLPEYHTAESALDFYGGLSGMARTERRRRAPELIELFGLKDAARRKIRTFSKGMKQRLGLAQAMLHDPDVLFLDEPTDGVDPVGRKEIRDLLLELKGRGKTIFLNSHLLGEVELVCDRVAILELGLLRREGSVADLTVTRDVYELRFDRSIDGLLPEIERRVRALSRIGGGIEVEVDDQGKLNALVDYIRNQGINLTGLTPKKQTLEDAFLQAIGPDAAGPAGRPGGGDPKPADRT